MLHPAYSEDVEAMADREIMSGFHAMVEKLVPQADQFAIVEALQQYKRRLGPWTHPLVANYQKMQPWVFWDVYSWISPKLAKLALKV